MDPKTRALAIAASVCVLLTVIELVRRRKLKEEYSLLWVATALVLLVLSIWYQLLLDITQAIGAVMPSSTLFFFGLIFVMLMLLHFSVRVSALERRMTALVQELGIMGARADVPGATDGADGRDEPTDALQAEPGLRA
jgi:hypothetical protein